MTETDHAHGERDRRHQHQPLGDHRHERGDHAAERGTEGLSAREQLVVDDEQARRNHQVGDEFQDLVDPGAQFRVHERELAGLLGEPGRVRIAADLRGAVGAAARRDETAGEDPRAEFLVHGVGLAGEQRFVEFESLGLDDDAVDHRLVAGSEFDDVVEHHVVRRQLGHHPVAADEGLGLADDREPVEGPLGADLLHDADGAVEDDQQAEHAVDDRSGGQDDGQQDAEDRVDAGEDVGADDLSDRPRRPVRHVVGGAPGHPFGDLLGGQTQRDVPRVGRGHSCLVGDRGGLLCCHGKQAKPPVAIHPHTVTRLATRLSGPGGRTRAGRAPAASCRRAGGGPPGPGRRRRPSAVWRSARGHH